jgi:DNA polymerase-3 subunit alpha
MLLAQSLAGFSKGDADVLRKAMGKKQKAVLDKMKAQFVDGAMKKGHPKDKLEKIWTDWEAFAQYAFNKSHSTCYAFVAYQTAYLKAHYPSEYMAAVLNNAGSIEKITFFMEECKRMGLEVLGPDINESKKGFAVNREGAIRFGLGGLKGVGEAAVDSIISERAQAGPYISIFDMIKRINQRSVNKKTLESLAYAGAFDCFPELHRAQYFFIPQGDTSTGLEKIIKYGNIYQAQSQGTTNTLFGDLPAVLDIPAPKIPPCDLWSLTDRLEKEKEVTGIFMSGHPLDNFRFEMKHYGITPISEFLEVLESTTLQASGKQYRLAGLVLDGQHRQTRTGRSFGSLSVEDYSGKTEIMLWGDDYMRFKDYLEKGKIIFVVGSFKNRFNSDKYEFKVERISLLESIKHGMTKQVTLFVEPRHVTEEMISFLEGNLVKYKGGSTSLRINLMDVKNQRLTSLYSLGPGLNMNDELAVWIQGRPEIEVKIDTT